MPGVSAKVFMVLQAEFQDGIGRYVGVQGLAFQVFEVLGLPKP